MDTKKLINLIELKDRYAIALMDHYINKGLNTKDLQKYTDSVCDDWAKTFIALHNRELSDRQTQIAIFRYLDSLGVKKGHSSKRFSEALHRQLHNIYSNNESKIELSK